MTIPTSDLVAQLRAEADEWEAIRAPLDCKLALVWRQAADELERCHAYEREVAPTIAACNEKVEEFAEALKKAEAREARFRAILGFWLKAYDDCGPDNGPSILESECAELARQALSEDEK